MLRPRRRQPPQRRQRPQRRPEGRLACSGVTRDALVAMSGVTRDELVAMNGVRRGVEVAKPQKRSNPAHASLTRGPLRRRIRWACYFLAKQKGSGSFAVLAAFAPRPCVGHLLDKKEKPRSAPRGFRLPTLRSCCVPRTEEGSSTASSLFRPKPQSSDFLFHDDQGGGKRRAGMVACEKRKSPAASRGAFGGAAIRGWGCYLGCCARANLPNRDRGAKFLSAPSSLL
jgi:hypothetical protein